jgi:uncharacterized membrane protein YhiD involved in acid resistance
LDTFLGSNGDQSILFNNTDVFSVLLLSFLLSMIIGFIYRYTHKGASYSQSYVHTLVIIGTVVALIMLIIGSNIAKAFALVGALSIVRFRNAMKETRDVAFIFMIMAIGMSVGTRFYFMGIVATIVLSGIVLFLYKFNIFAKDIQEKVLRIRISSESDYENLFYNLFNDKLQEYRLISLETVKSGTLYEVVYSVVLKKETSVQKLLEEIRKLNDNQKVTLVLGHQEVDL